MGDIDTSPNFVINCERLLAKKLVMLHKRDHSVCVNLHNLIDYLGNVIFSCKTHFSQNKKVKKECRIIMFFKYYRNCSKCILAETSLHH